MTVQEAIKWLKAISVTLEMNDFHKSSLLERKEALHMGIQSMRELEQYRALGTVEELKEAREKQIPKNPIVKPLGQDIEVECPTCGNVHIFLDTKKGDKYCNHCGQAIDWEEGGTSD